MSQTLFLSHLNLELWRQMTNGHIAGVYCGLCSVCFQRVEFYGTAFLLKFHKSVQIIFAEIEGLLN